MSTELRTWRNLSLGAVLAAAYLLIASAARAQQINGVPGSPSATMTLDGKQLPPPPLPFRGVIKESAKDSKPYWPPRVVPPKDSPNILFIMTDDQGYGVSNALRRRYPDAYTGSHRPDRIALHAVPLDRAVLPTRAALITGRNHHSVGSGVIGELSTGYPGYDSIIGPENATIGTILRDNGYATSWFGKNHNTPPFQYSVAGPFDQVARGDGLPVFLWVHGW